MLGKIYYKKELQNTYFIMADAEKELIESFTGQMILKGKIKGISSCSMQLIDGNREIRYDVTSLKTLEQSFSVKEMDYGFLSSMMIQIMDLMEDMERNLADGNGIIFAPEYLYTDTGSGRLFFLYDFTQIHEKSRILDLAEYCIERVDNKEEAAVDLAYYFYEHARGEHFSLREVEEYLDSKKISDNKSENPQAVYEEKAEDGEINSVSNNFVNIQEERYVNIEKEDTYEEKALSLKEEIREDTGDKNLKKEGSRGRFLGGVCSMALSVISFVFYFVMSFYFIFEPWVEIAWITASIFLAAVGGGLIILDKKRKIQAEAGDNKEDIREMELASQNGGSFYRKDKMQNKKEEELWENMVSQRTNNEYDPGKYKEPSPEGYYYQENKPSNGNDGDGKTVYVGKEDTSKEHFLIGRHNGRDREYPIMNYPWIVGKERERVNMHIKESTVSRIHARLTSSEGEVFLEDLASTNGTSLNDFPLAPHEKIRLKKGDVILFGRSEFVFE